MIAILASAVTGGVLSGVMNLVLIPYLTLQLGSPQVAGWIFSAGMFAAVFCGPLIGILSDRRGNRTSFILLIGVVSTAAILGLAVPWKPVLALSAVLIVLSYFCFLAPYTALIGDHSLPETRDRNFGYFMGTINLSMFLTSLLLSSAFERHRGLCLLLLAVCDLFPMLWTVGYATKHPAPPVQPPQEQGQRAMLSFIRESPGVLIFYLMQFGFWFSYGGLFPYLTSFLTNAAHLTLGRASVWVGATTMVCGLAALSTGFCTRRIGQRSLFLSSLLILLGLSGGLAFAYAGIMARLWGACYGLLSFFLFSVTSGFLWSLLPSLLSRLIQDYDRGRAFGFSNMVMIGAQSIAVALLGATISRQGYQQLFLMVFLGFALALGAAAYLYFFRQVSAVARAAESSPPRAGV